MSRLNPTTSACRMAASFRLRELGPRISVIGRHTYGESSRNLTSPRATQTIVGFGVHRRPEERGPAVRYGRQVMGRWVYRLRSSAAFVGLLFVALISLRAEGDETRLAISGYDPVAYFTDGKPVLGMTQFQHVWHDSPT